jgi:hypothetical protein
MDLHDAYLTLGWEMSNMSAVYPETSQESDS